MASGDGKLRLYNTLTREKADFVPLDPGNVRMYVCGPTVYDYAHIGNARPVIVFDVLFRLLRHLAAQGVWDGGRGETKVTYVRNITDVDDKINARAARDYPDLPLNEAIRKVTESTNAQFQADVKALGCLEPSVQPRATEHVAEMIAMTQTLVAKGNAYAAEGHVLFDIKSFRSGNELEYGKLSRRSLDDMIAGARVEVAPYKRDPMDFVLWKPSSPEEPGWESPWGRGRPGWHLECSAMSEKHLGEMFDIHGGGIDLAFPHHENELAQSRCAHDTPMMAQVWMHNGFLQVEGKKMAKSEGNFVTINELLNTGWDGRVLRFLMLKTHYRQPIDWTRKGLVEAGMELSKFKLWMGLGLGEQGVTLSGEFSNAIRDDVNTPGAIASLHSLLGKISSKGHVVDAELDKWVHELQSGLTLLGIEALDDYDFNAMMAGITYGAGEVTVTEEHVERAIEARLAALNVKNFTTADRIRAELLEQGVQLMDSKDPATGERITTWEVKR